MTCCSQGLGLDLGYARDIVNQCDSRHAASYPDPTDGSVWIAPRLMADIVARHHGAPEIKAALEACPRIACLTKLAGEP